MFEPQLLSVTLKVMFRKIIFFLIFFVVLLFPKNALSQSEFQVDVNVDYTVSASGQTEVSHTVALENLFSNLYATSYVLNLENIQPINAQATSNGKVLELTQSSQGENTILKVTFDDAAVGRGEKNTFNISYTEDSFAIRTGEVWEISIPRLSDEISFRSYNVNLIVPTALGGEAYVSPNPNSRRTEGLNRIYSYTKDRVSKTGIVAGFGAFQVFSFTLNYHIENPLTKKALIDIAMPPDTAYQRVYYQDLNEKPSKITADEDGNWLARYELKPRERKDIVLSGVVQIFAGPRAFPAPSELTLQKNLEGSEFWQVDDPEIIAIANSMTSPRDIYNYVSTLLTYDYDRVKPNVSRKGATLALQTPNNSICMEYTDLFIAIARAAGIPAREVNGFAYTENPEIQPLSLVADVLHSWPEYWDETNKVWVPIDPTWASTTGGIDYFNKLDLRHFNFVNHGIDPNMPYPPGSYKLGSNPQKDVFVNFGQLPQERTSSPQITARVGNNLPFIGARAEIEIYNSGPVALYDLDAEVLFDNAFVMSEPIEFLAPFSTATFTVRIPFSFMGTKTPTKVFISVDGSSLEIDANKRVVLIYNLLGVFLGLGLITLLVMVRLKKIKLNLSFLRKLKSKKHVQIQNEEVEVHEEKPAKGS